MGLMFSIKCLRDISRDIVYVIIILNGNIFLWPSPFFRIEKYLLNFTLHPITASFFLAAAFLSS